MSRTRKWLPSQTWLLTDGQTQAREKKVTSLIFLVPPPSPCLLLLGLFFYLFLFTLFLSPVFHLSPPLANTFHFPSLVIFLTPISYANVGLSFKRQRKGILGEDRWPRMSDEKITKVKSSSWKTPSWKGNIKKGK